MTKMQLTPTLEVRLGVQYSGMYSGLGIRQNWVTVMVLPLNYLHGSGCVTSGSLGFLISETGIIMPT